MHTATLHQPVPSRNSDEALLKKFAESSSEKAFGELVEKYLGMVLGIAIRRTGDRTLAEEIAQDVFMILARKAKRLKSGSTLAGWIHRVTVIECAEMMRRQSSEKTKMNAFSRHLASESDGRDVWREALPLLDEGIDGLSSAEREVVLLRFFERKSFREIGAALGKSDDAAQKQTERALQKLSSFLKRKGVSVPIAILSAGLANHLAQAAPSVLTQSIAHGALINAATFDAKILILEALQSMTNTKLKAAMVAGAVLTVPIVAQWTENSRLREALTIAQQQQGRNAFAVNPNTINGVSNTNRAAASSTGSSITARNSPASGGLAIGGGDPAPEAAAHDWEHVLFIADPLQRSLRLSQLLGALTAENAPQAAEAFQRVKDAGIKFSDEQRLFLRAWGKIDGAAAVSYAVTHGGQKSDEAVAALGGWAAAAPQQAKAWLDALPQSDAKETLIYGLLDGWSTVDFQAAAAYAESQPASAARDKFRELLLQRALRSGGIAAAQNWVDQISSDDQHRDYKQRAFGDVIQAMLYRDPAAAARWITELNGQPFVGARAIANTAAKLAETSPTDALDWLTALKSTDANNLGRGAGAVLQKWAQQNPQTAGTWLQQNASHPYYDQMVVAYAQTVVSTDRDAAGAWAQTIRNEQLREKTLAAMDQRQQKTTNLASLAFVSARGDNVLLDLASERLDTSVILDRSETVQWAIESDTSSHTAVMGDVTIQSAKVNPHGSAPQWTNCASCHKQ